MRTATQLAQDRHLAQLAQQGDGEALNTLLTCHRDRLMGLAITMIHDVDAAEDLVQQTLMRTARHIGRFDPQSSFYTWINVILMNCVRNHIIRHKKVWVVALSELVRDGTVRRRTFYEAVCQRSSPLDEIIEQEERLVLESRIRSIRARVSRLKPRYRTLIKLREFENKSYGEISTILGIGIGSVKSQLHYARAALADPPKRRPRRRPRITAALLGRK